MAGSADIDGLRTRGDLRRFIEEVLADPGVLTRRSPISIEKAGTISDADFARTPRNHTMGIDTSNNRLYIRYGGAWHYATLT